MPHIFKKLQYNRTTAWLAGLYYKIKARKIDSYIFVATTGRSGTLTLVDIFDQLESCVALHEPYPAMHDRVLNAAANGNDKEVEQFYKIRKSINIRRSASGARYYLEANHLFIKTFIKFAAEDFGSKLKVIHLVRNPIQVANSIYTLQDQPGTIEGNRWWLDYKAPTNLVNVADVLDHDESFQHPYYKALWYWFELESRVTFWKQKLPDVNFIFFKTENFNNEKELTNLFKALAIKTPDCFTQKVTNMRSHTRSHQKKTPPIVEAQAKIFLNRFLGLLEKQHIPLPDSLNVYY